MGEGKSMLPCSCCTANGSTATSSGPRLAITTNGVSLGWLRHHARNHFDELKARLQGDCSSRLSQHAAMASISAKSRSRWYSSALDSCAFAVKLGFAPKRYRTPCDIIAILCDDGTTNRFAGK